MQTINLLIGILAAWVTALPGQTVQPLSGTFSNMSASKQSGDIHGYEIVVVPQAGGPWIVFQCSEGAPSSPVLVPIKENGNSFSFVVKDPGNVCNGSYVARRDPSGLTLLGAADGETQNLTKGKSYWANHGALRASYERTAKPFFKALRSSCPAKHLEDLPGPELNYQIELF